MGLDQLKLADAGQHPARVPQQLVDGTGGHGRVEALLLHRGPDDDFAVRPGNDIDRRGTRRARCG